MHVFVADKLPTWCLQRLTDLGCCVHCETGLTGSDLAAAAVRHHTEILIVRSTKVTREVIEACASLKLILRAGSGVDTIDVAAANERDVRVCNCPGMNSVAVAELAIGMMIALDRELVEETDDLRRGVWNKKKYSSHAMGLKGRTLGIVGLGRIGVEVAKRCRAFEMDLTYFDTVRRPKLERELGLTFLPLDELLAAADFVTLHVPGGAQTHHLIGARELALMKPTAYLVNCSRGGVVDEGALAAALEDNALAGAALDVYEIEPGAQERDFRDPIVGEPHVYGTHHVGASTEQAQAAVAEEALRIVEAFVARGDYLHCVNPPVATTT